MHDAGALEPLETVQISGEMPLWRSNQNRPFTRQQVTHDSVPVIAAEQADVAMGMARRVQHIPAVVPCLDDRTVLQRGVERSEERHRVGMADDGRARGLREVPCTRRMVRMVVGQHNPFDSVVSQRVGDGVLHLPGRRRQGR